MSIQERSTLVLGGTGKTGRRVARRLMDQGLPVRIGARSATPAFDWTREETWSPALRGVGSVYIAYHPDLTAPGAADHLGRFSRLAVKSGVRRLVLLSGRGDGVLPGERAVRESGAAFTILRAAAFCQNFDEGVFLDSVLAGELAFPAGDVVEPFVDVDDIAEVAVAALNDDAHAGQVYEVTGPELLTFAQAVAEIADASGRPVRYVPVSLERYAAALAPHVPAEALALYTELFRDLFGTQKARLGDGVERSLGHKPRTFREYARAAAAAGAWARGAGAQAK